MTVDFNNVLRAFEMEAFRCGSPSRGDLEDRSVAAARRGWNSSGTNAAWPPDAEHAVRDYFRTELTQDVLESHEDGSEAWALFASFAVGWLFALKTAGDDESSEYEAAFAVLPGFMWLNEQRVV